MITSKLAIANIATGNSSAIDDNMSTSLRDAQSWRHFWQAHCADTFPMPVLPEVDFDNEIVILYMLGLRSRGSTAVVVESVEDDGKVLTVTVATKTSSGLSTSAMCNPFTIIKVQADKSRQVKFNLRAPQPSDMAL